VPNGTSKVLVYTAENIHELLAHLNERTFGWKLIIDRTKMRIQDKAVVEANLLDPASQKRCNSVFTIPGILTYSYPMTLEVSEEVRSLLFRKTHDDKNPESES